MRRIALCIAVGLLVALADSGLAQELKLQCPTGTEMHGKPFPDGFKAWCELPDGTQQGPSITWYESGRPEAEAHFDAGKLDGVFKLWHENGQLAEEGHYVADQRNGEFSTWDEDGTKRLEQHFVDGKRYDFHACPGCD